MRGAPAIGVAAAYGLALAAQASDGLDATRCSTSCAQRPTSWRATRPTAVNLSWALDRVLAAAERRLTPNRCARRCWTRRSASSARSIEADRRLGGSARSCCRTARRCSRTATPARWRRRGYGTALGVVRAAVEQGKRVRVVATETRPLLQGARLTAWELARDGIDCTLIVDSAAGALMRRGAIDAVIVGADRIAANGDTANKIGTYALAVLARAHGVPFYVAAPTSTIDLSLPAGDDIPIEERSPDEVTTSAGVASRRRASPRRTRRSTSRRTS